MVLQKKTRKKSKQVSYLLSQPLFPCFCWNPKLQLLVSHHQRLGKFQLLHLPSLHRFQRRLTLLIRGGDGCGSWVGSTAAQTLTGRTSAPIFLATLQQVTSKSTGAVGFVMDFHVQFSWMTWREIEAERADVSN